MEELPHVRFFEEYDVVFRPMVGKAYLSGFKKHIKDNYRVSEFVQMRSGKWIIRLERTFDSYMEKGEA